MIAAIFSVSIRSRPSSVVVQATKNARHIELAFISIVSRVFTPDHRGDGSISMLQTK